MVESFDVVVIGSGPGGYAAAIRCAQRGASVAVIEKDLIGGTCLNRGCIPSKTLLASAHTLLMLKHATLMGVDVPSANPNWPKIQARKDAVVAGFRKGLTGLIKSHKVTIIQGRAVVTAPGQIKVESDTGSTEIQAGGIILATGSQPIEIPSIPFDGQTVISSKEALGLQDIPQSMVIVGGGVIGCEMACVYAAMGTKVTIVEALSRLIPMEDEWVGRLMAREFKKLRIDSLTDQKVTSVETSGSPAKVVLESGQTIDTEKVLVSVGRRAVVDQETVEALNLQMNRVEGVPPSNRGQDARDTNEPKAAGLKTSGFGIAVNAKMETNAPGVYAIGDVVGTTYLAHGAFAEAEVAVMNVTGGDEAMTDYSLIPRAVYTFPEIASVGKSKQACQSQGLDVSVGKAFFKANGRSNAHNETIGEIRVIKDNATERIVGVTMVGAIVTELISAARALIGTTEKITEISFPHPTVSEVLKEAAEDAFGLSLHNPPKI
ncbi:dihydrolipoyl dehydrogenase family protein [Planctomycetota bacterium]